MTSESDGFGLMERCDADKVGDVNVTVKDATGSTAFCCLSGMMIHSLANSYFLATSFPDHQQRCADCGRRRARSFGRHRFDHVFDRKAQASARISNRLKRPYFPSLLIHRFLFALDDLVRIWGAIHVVLIFCDN